MRYIANDQIKFLIHIIECVNWYFKCMSTGKDWLSHMSNRLIQYVLRWDETQYTEDNKMSGKYTKTYGVALIKYQDDVYNK